MAQRNPYLISGALRHYLGGGVFAAISGSIATTIDAVIVSRILGQKALSAVNIVMPVLTLFATFMILFCTGASIVAAKAIGNRNRDKVNLSFSSCFVVTLITGIVLGALTYIFLGDIINFLSHDDATIRHFATKYLEKICYALPMFMIASVLEYFVRTDGNSRLVMTAVIAGTVVNAILDIVFVGYTKMGISGAAWATGINYLVCFLICLIHFGSKNNTIGWSFNLKKYPAQIKESSRLGFSTCLNTLFLAVCLYTINIMVIKFEGNEGIYCWAVCYQIFLILQMVLSGIDSGIFSIGGVLQGEDDVSGLEILNRKCALYTFIFVVVLSLSIIFFPGFFGMLFGNTGDDRLHLLPKVLKVFSLFLLPFAFVTLERSIYTILGRGKLSLILSVASYGSIVLAFYLFSLFDKSRIWWSFPAASVSLFILVFLYTVILHIKDPNLRLLSLIPEKESGPSLNISVKTDAEDVANAEKDIMEFMRSNSISEETAQIVENTCGSVMNDILRNLAEEDLTNRYFDLHIRLKSGKINVLFKDDGKEYNPAANLQPFPSSSQSSDKEKPSVTKTPDNTSLSVNYIYMNRQNILMLEFT